MRRALQRSRKEIINCAEAHDTVYYIRIRINIQRSTVPRALGSMREWNITTRYVRSTKKPAKEYWASVKANVDV